MPKTSKSNMKTVPELPDDKAIFINEERPTMMYVGRRDQEKAGWKKTTEIPSDRELRQTETGMFVLAKKS